MNDRREIYNGNWREANKIISLVDNSLPIAFHKKCLCWLCEYPLYLHGYLMKDRVITWLTFESQAGKERKEDIKYWAECAKSEWYIFKDHKINAQVYCVDATQKLYLWESNIIRSHKCGCGSPATMLFSSIECTNIKCRNYVSGS